MTSSQISGNQININKPLNHTPPTTCPLTIYSVNGSLPCFASILASTDAATNYFTNSTVDTSYPGGLMIFAGSYGNQMIWYTKFGSVLSRFNVISQGSIFFTGQHKTQPDNDDIKKNIDEYVGKIMSSNDTGYTSHDTDGNKITGSDAIYLTEALPNCSLSCIDNDPCVFGIVTNAPNGNKPDNPLFLHDSDNTFRNNLYGSVRVNSLGEGAMWVSNINGPIKNGDWITSSRIPGIGKRQSDEFMHNYTVAKATMSCNFDLQSEKYESKTVLFESNEYAMAYIGVTYHCG
jgi:hypothetical protein